ncbi:MAG: HNH endonuclease domain-containing protein [Myxococcota bacterium]
MGFATLARWEDADAGQRPGVRWVTFLFELGADAGSRPIDQLATVISTRERKVATYKLALLRALNDIAMTQPHMARWRDDGSVEVPIDAIAARWVTYYWRLFEAPVFLPQQQGEQSRGTHVLGFARELTSLVKHYKHAGGFLAFTRDERQGLKDREAALQSALMKALRRTIFAGPVTYAGGALGTGRLFQKSGSNVVVPGPLWRELSLLGHWIGDALVLRWAELTERLSEKRVTAGEVLDHLLPMPEQERDTNHVREIFAGGAHCVWTGQRVRGASLQIDHVLPWALWHNNDLWNLVPASNRANNSKSDQLPERGFLKSRRSAFVDAWTATRESLPERFRRDAEGQLGRRLGSDEAVLEELFDVVTEAVERTRLQRGLGAWTPS